MGSLGRKKEERHAWVIENILTEKTVKSGHLILDLCVFFFFLCILFYCMPWDNRFLFIFKLTVYFLVCLLVFLLLFFFFSYLIFYLLQSLVS